MEIDLSKDQAVSTLGIYPKDASLYYRDTGLSMLIAALGGGIILQEVFQTHLLMGGY